MNADCARDLEMLDHPHLRKIQCQANLMYVYSMRMRAIAFALLISTLFSFAAKSAGISGNSVLISRDGYLITAEHVIAGCASLNALSIGPVIAVGHDKANDLALLKSNAKITAEPLPLSMAAIQRGDEVIAAGYPLQGISGGLHVMKGIVRDLPNNRTRLEFIAKPSVQPGNSGGAVLDRSGSLVGIMSTKRIFGRGVFAVTGEVVQIFLSAQSVKPVLADGKPERSREEIAELARKSVFAIECLN
jgi:S1-C subfamily serine protease